MGRTVRASTALALAGEFGRTEYFLCLYALLTDNAQLSHTVEYGTRPMVTQPETSRFSAQTGFGHYGASRLVEKDEMEISCLLYFIETIGYNDEPYPTARYR